MSEKEYLVELVIESKPSLKDPEGATIANDLMKKNGFASVAGVRTAKLLKIRLRAANEKQAAQLVEKMCHDLRLANPVAQDYTIVVKK